MRVRCNRAVRKSYLNKELKEVKRASHACLEGEQEEIEQIKGRVMPDVF